MVQAVHKCQPPGPKIKILMEKSLFIILSVSLAVISSCCGNTDPWSDHDLWYQSDREINSGYADIFYLVSTDIIHEEYPDGTLSYVAFNTEEEKQILASEMRFVEDSIFRDSLNFFSPFYHQLTLDAAYLGSTEYHKMISGVADEAYDSFRYYMSHLNDGRPVVLAGFSQGALLVKELLKRMTPEELSSVAVSFLLGWGINEDDTIGGRIIPAEGPDDTGVCVAINTIADTSGIWPLVMDDAAYSINPVNWSTGPEPASFTFDNQSLTVRMDTSSKALIVEGFEDPPLSFSAPWPEGCLHHYEILFYNKYLNRNALQRVRQFLIKAESDSRRPM